MNTHILNRRLPNKEDSVGFTFVPKLRTSEERKRDIFETFHFDDEGKER